MSYSLTSCLAWINQNIPIEMPIGPLPTVEMTFQESARFGLSDEDSLRNWAVLFNTNSFGLGVQHLGPYHFRYLTSAYHSLHCLYVMHEDFDKPNHVETPSHHFVSCSSMCLPGPGTHFARVPLLVVPASNPSL